MEEIWKDIPGYEGLYRISNSGEIISLHKHNFGQKIKKVIHWKGYLYVKLTDANGTRKGHRLHRVLMFVFNPTEDKSLQVNHIDGNKANNLYNPRASTGKARMRRSWKAHYNPRG